MPHEPDERERQMWIVSNVQQLLLQIRLVWITSPNPVLTQALVSKPAQLTPMELLFQTVASHAIEPVKHAMEVVLLTALPERMLMQLLILPVNVNATLDTKTYLRILTSTVKDVQLAVTPATVLLMTIV